MRTFTEKADKFNASTIKISRIPPTPVARLSTNTSINVLVCFLIFSGIGRINNSRAALLMDCLKLPSDILSITAAIRDMGLKKSMMVATNIKPGRKTNDMPTPSVPTTRRVRNSCSKSEITLKVEYQNPKNAVNSSASPILAEAIPPNWKSTSLATNTLMPTINAM